MYIKNLGFFKVPDRHDRDYFSTNARPSTSEAHTKSLRQHQAARHKCAGTIVLEDIIER